MKFAIQINADPYSSGAAENAYQFIAAALRLGHDVTRVFFYREGACHALRWAKPPQDERQWGRRWADLARQGVDLVVCISSAQRRGLLSQEEAARLGKQDEDLAEGFRLAGLGLWLEACLEADRFLVFGA